MRTKIAVIVVLALVFGIVIGFSFSKLLASSPDSFSQGEQEKTASVTVVAEQIAHLTFQNGDYNFTYAPVSGHVGKFSVITPAGGYSWYNANQDAVYYDSGIKITVTETYSNYIVLFIESNVPNNETP